MAIINNLFTFESGMTYALPSIDSSNRLSGGDGLFGFLKERIYLQVLLMYALGIALSGQLIMPDGLLQLVFLPAVVLIACLLGLHLQWQFSASRLAMLPASLAIITAGFFYGNLAIHQVSDAPLLSYCSEENVRATAVVQSLPKYQRGHLRFLASVQSVADSPPGNLGRCQFYYQCEPGFVLSPGDKIRFWSRFEEVEAPRNRGQFNYRAYLLQRGTLVTSYLPGEQFMDIVDDRGSRRLAWLTVLRGHLTSSLTSGLPEDLQDLAVSVVYGDKITDLDEELQERFRRAGLTHILVASGTQVSLLIVLMAMALWRSPRSFDTRGTMISILQFAVTIGVVAIYAGITGYETSIVRALCMGILLCAGRLFLRNVDGLSTLSQAGLILLLAQPLQLFTPGFQLSFLATFGLIYMMGTLHPLIAHLAGWRRFILDGLLTTGGAQLFVTPVLAASFNQFSLVGLLSNLLAVPLSLVLLICGALASFGLSSVPVIGPVLNWLVYFFSLLLDRLATLFADMPFASIAVPAPPAWILLTFYALVLLAGECFRNRDQLTARQLLVLQPVGLLLTWLLCGWIGMRFMLPRPELSLLRLERSFAIYYDRPAAGRYLIVNPYWISRRHNADNLLSALKSRGVSSLESVYWLGDVPADNPLQTLSDSQAQLNMNTEEVPFHKVSSQTGELAGMICPLGSSLLGVVWDAEHQLLYPPRAGNQLDGLLTVSPRDASQEEFMSSRVTGNAGSGINWLSLDQTSVHVSGDYIISDAEISIEPAPEDRLRSFTFQRKQ